jgi:hypothetical protein
MNTLKGRNLYIKFSWTIKEKKRNINKLLEGIHMSSLEYKHTCRSLFPRSFFLMTHFFRKEKENLFFQCFVIIYFILNLMCVEDYYFTRAICPRDKIWSLHIYIRYDDVTHRREEEKDQPCVIVNGIEGITCIVVIQWTCCIYVCLSRMIWKVHVNI